MEDYKRPPESELDIMLVVWGRVGGVILLVGSLVACRTTDQADHIIDIGETFALVKESMTYENDTVSLTVPEVECQAKYPNGEMTHGYTFTNRGPGETFSYQLEHAPEALTKLIVNLFIDKIMRTVDLLPYVQTGEPSFQDADGIEIPLSFPARVTGERELTVVLGTVPLRNQYYAVDRIMVYEGDELLQTIEMSSLRLKEYSAWAGLFVNRDMRLVSRTYGT